jgi:hypothetical protein
MSQAAIAPAVASAPVESPQAGGSNEPRILDNEESITSALNEGQPADDGEGQPADDGEGAPDDADIPGDAEGEADHASETDQLNPAVAPPATWTAEEKAAFAKLPADLQKTVARRESEREQFVNTKAQETALAKQERQQIAEWTMSKLAPAVAAAQVAVEYEFANINWNELQKTDPATFLQLDAMRKERLHAVEQATRAFTDFQKQQQAAAVKETALRLKQEFAHTVPVIEKLMGPNFDKKTYKAELTAYLKESGAPEEHINGIVDGYQLAIVTKAMLYDKMRKASQSAQQKVKTAPHVQSAKARPGANKPEGAAAAKNILKRGSSNENIAAALEAYGI